MVVIIVVVVVVINFFPIFSYIFPYFLQGPRPKEEELWADQRVQFRSLAMRLCYLALDRPDLQYSCKELARRMSAPTAAD